ncbi:MAG: FecR domain-containing protein [Spirochaetes bacterium]|nr:FecR domain-containing protein [Spirochaetota bacterium]
MTELEVLIDGKTARKGDPVREGTVVNLASGSAARLIFDTGIRIDLAGKTDMGVDKFTADTANGVNMSISLHEGTLVSAIQRGEVPVVYEYVTPNARIEPLGTEFLLQASGGITLAIVKEGGILVTNMRTGKQVRVSAGGKCIITDTLLSAEASGQDLGIFSDIDGLRAGKYAHLLLPDGIGQKGRPDIKTGTTERADNPSVRDDDNSALENRAIRDRIEHESSREIIRQRSEENRMQMNEMRRNSRMNMNQQKMRGR